MGLNPVTPGTSRWAVCAFLEMRPNEKAEVVLFRVTLMHLLLMQGPFVLPTQSHTPGSIPISIHTQLKSGSLYLHIKWKMLCVLHLWLPLKCSLQAITQQFFAC